MHLTPGFEAIGVGPFMLFLEDDGNLIVQASEAGFGVVSDDTMPTHVTVGL
jgi:hypothetical protein